MFPYKAGNYRECSYKQHLSIEKPMVTKLKWECEVGHWQEERILGNSERSERFEGDADEEADQD